MHAPAVDPTGTIETPAMQGRLFRTDLLGEQRAIAHAWRLMAFALSVCLCAMIGVLWHLALQPRDVPVYIEVDTATGSMRVLAHGDDTPVRAATIEQALRTFVAVLRRVSTDKALMQQDWKALFLRVTPRAFQTLSAYAIETNPLGRPGEVRVEILRVLRQSAQTYDLRWRESLVNEQGVLTESQTYSGLFTWALRQPGGRISREERIANPAGIYLDTWSWSKE